MLGDTDDTFDVQVQAVVTLRDIPGPNPKQTAAEMVTRALEDHDLTVTIADVGEPELVEVPGA